MIARDKSMQGYKIIGIISNWSIVSFKYYNHYLSFSFLSRINLPNIVIIILLSISFQKVFKSSNCAKGKLN